MSVSSKQNAQEIYNNVKKQCAKDDAYDKWYFNNIDTEDNVNVLFGEFNEEYQLDCSSRARDMR